MGTDIHACAEVRTEDGWVSSRWEPERDYVLFALLANVRNSFELEPISHPRGLPANCDDDLAALRFKKDGFSASWLSLKELQSYDWKALPTLLRIRVSRFFEQDVPALQALGAHVDVRVCFFFSL